MSAKAASIATALLQTDSCPTSIVIASTSTHFSLIRDLSSAGLVDAVVGNGECSTMLPCALLGHMGTAMAPRKIAIFTDQLWCSTNAPVLTSKAMHHLYLSGLEIILNEIHGFRLLVQIETGFIEIPPASSAESILTAIWKHLDMCAALGDEWLAKGFHHRRYPQWRSDTARRQLRLFHSSLLHMSLAHADFDKSHIFDINRQLTEARIRCR